MRSFTIFIKCVVAVILGISCERIWIYILLKIWLFVVVCRIFFLLFIFFLHTCPMRSTNELYLYIILTNHRKFPYFKNFCQKKNNNKYLYKIYTLTLFQICLHICDHFCEKLHWKRKRSYDVIVATQSVRHTSYLFCL